MCKVLKLAEDLYLSNGVVARAEEHGLFDGDEGMVALEELTRNRFEGLCNSRKSERLTVFGFSRSVIPDSRAKYTLLTRQDYKDLPESVKAVLREELPEYATEF